MPRVAHDDDEWEDNGEEWQPDDEEADWQPEPDLATVPCPYCGQEMLEESIRCPSCGQYMSEEDQPAPAHSPWIIGGFILAFIAAVLWLVNRG